MNEVRAMIEGDTQSVNNDEGKNFSERLYAVKKKIKGNKVPKV